MKIATLGLPMGVLAVSLLAACQNTARGVEQDTDKNTAAAREASRDAGDAASRAGQDTKNAAENAGDAIKDAASKAGNEVKDAAEKAADGIRDASRDVANGAKDASDSTVRKANEASDSTGAKLDAAQQTAEIKTALIGEKNVDAAGIDVDTDAATRTVTLRGHVPTAAQKATAERIAETKAPSYKVVNRLVVR